MTRLNNNSTVSTKNDEAKAKTPTLKGAEDTIFSLSSAPGQAGVSVYRISGPASAETIRQLSQKKCPKARFAALRRLYNVDSKPIDEALVLWFPGPASFTGEDSAEFHTHGSPAVTQALSHTLLSLGLLQAEPGEFTRRAVQNGKLDLTEAEGLADLIDAQTEGQRVQALRQMGGGLKELYENWRETILDALAQIEGEIDFPDEADIPDNLSHGAYTPLTEVMQDMQKARGDMGRGAAIRSGLDIAIIGAPNVGKSTLINALTRREIAITSPEAGTTRDIVEAQMVISGLPVTLSDTAGLRVTENKIEAEGVRRAKKRAQDSEITIYVIRSGVSDYDGEIAKSLSVHDIIYVNAENADFELDKETVTAVIIDDLLSGEGEKRLYEQLEKTISENFSVGQDVGLTRERHADCVRRAESAIERARSHLAFSPELAGDDLRTALRAIAELAGEADIEAVFDRIFSRFCVGK
jgi:tRNA modification GTPase